MLCLLSGTFGSCINTQISKLELDYIGCALYRFCGFLWAEHKLFIGMLPKGASKADVMAVFSPYGVIKELSVIKGSQPTSKGEINSLLRSPAIMSSI